MDTIRSFIAIELAAEVKAEVAKIQSVLIKAGEGTARWVKPESIHLTLCFLGDIQESGVTSVREAIDRTASCFGEFDLHLGRPGAFPAAAQPQTIWVGLEGDLGRLAEMQIRLVNELRPTGYKPENRPFSPHLTLARMRPEASLAARQNLSAALTNWVGMGTMVVHVKALSLMKSRLAPGGAIYTRLSKTDLKG
jgi:RNA 2',3'-cyclic 3'-phosphodiesterase